VGKTREKANDDVEEQGREGGRLARDAAVSVRWGE